jgi:hypothetical protein
VGFDTIHVLLMGAQKGNFLLARGGARAEMSSSVAVRIIDR